MKIDEFPEMRQFFGFVYTDPYNFIPPEIKFEEFVPLPIDRKFREFRPVDAIHGAMVEHLSSSTPPFFTDLISPFEPKEVISIMKNAKKYGILKHSVEKDMGIKIQPGPEEMHYTLEVNGHVPSRSRSTVIQRPAIRRAFDSYKFELGCSCEEFLENRWICGIWHPLILSEWGIPITGEKYQVEPVDSHHHAIADRIERTYGPDYKALGTGPDSFKKPYLMAYLEVLERYPSIPEYIIDWALTFYSPIFDDLKKEVNSRRRSCGLENLTMYDKDIHRDVSVRQYTGWKLNEGLKYNSRKKGMPEHINDVIELLNFDSPVDIESPVYITELDIFSNE
jgi:hypothetical protein